MYVLEVNKKTLFIKMKEVFPECEFLIRGEPQLYPFICLRTEQCHRGLSCMPRLEPRIRYIFDQFSFAELLVLYFRYQDKPKSQRAGLFWKDGREPRCITMNPYAWEKFKTIGTTYEWSLPDSLFLDSEKSELVQIGS